MRGKFVSARPRKPDSMPLWRRIRGKWFARDLVLVVVVALFVFGALTQAFWFLSIREIDTRVLIDIPEGASVRRIAALLHREGLVRDPAKFVLAAQFLRLTKDLQAGTYEFGPEFSELEVLLALRYGDVAGRRVTIPEGHRASQIARILQGNLGIDPAEFMRLVNDPALMSELGISAPSLEGYLHPDTYRFRLGTAPREAIVRMVKETRSVFDARRMTRADSLGMTVLEVLTLASIVEAEAMIDSERPRIAAVYYNRLRNGWRLEADPTVRYALGNYRRRVYYGDLDVDSPYNTYRHTGLPPGPICNPGTSSIEAALYPSRNTHEFFFVSNGDGSHTFSRTFEEHIRARNAVSERQDTQQGEFPLDTGWGE
ncbi:MAG: endolytic transglycosylase MltG [Candidatus Eisenbacteria bacterium]|nr:endolytic transglycosylase MltG [Candidatus Eisenbacteria bacterium]